MITLAERSILGNPDVLQAFKQLLAQLTPESRVVILDDVNPYLCAVLERGVSFFGDLPVTALAPLALAMLHCTLGTPLHLSDALLEAWSRGDGTVAECSRCGYRMPAAQGYDQCVLCGHPTGEAGIWAAKRGRNAGCN
jgi:hypothetical protein